MPKKIDRSGEIHTLNSGEIVKVIKNDGNKKCTIEFSDGTIKENINYSKLKSGGVRKPLNRIGEMHISNEGETMTIIEYISPKNITIKFDDGTIVKNLYFSNIKQGKVKNFNKPSVYGIGYIGYGENSMSTNNKNIASSKWQKIFYRSYDENYHKDNVTYKECSVDSRWYCFQNFRKWFENNFKPHMDKTWHLDKDLLVKGNKIYSPETCCFVPPEINCLFGKVTSRRGKYPIGVSKSGKMFHAQISLGREFGSISLGYYHTPKEAFIAYKIAKEKRIKQVADKWRDRINPELYRIMYEYKILITD